MNLTGIRSISLAVVIGLALFLVSLAVLGGSSAAVQAAGVSDTAVLVDSAVDQPGQPPPEQITFQPYFTFPDVFVEAPPQTVDVDGDGRDDGSFQALRVRISSDDGSAWGRLSLAAPEHTSYDFDVDWGWVTFDDDGIPNSVYLDGKGKKTRVNKIYGFSIKQKIIWEANVTRNPDAEDRLVWEIVSVTRFGITDAFSFDSTGRIVGDDSHKWRDE
jgi:hypothetical protein